MRTLRIFPLLALVVACGPVGEPLTPPPALPPAPPASAAPAAPLPLAIALDPAGAARIAADINYLASPELAGRGTGDKGNELARDFVVKRFTELGLSPAGDAGTFLQAFSARVGADAKPPELSSALPKGKPRAVADAEARVADGSTTAKASGKAVFVGYGITAPAVGWDDYGGADLTGKIAVILDGVPPHAGGAPSKPGAAPALAAKAPPSDKPGAAPAPVAKGPPSDKPEAPPANPLRDFGSVRYKLRTAREHKAAGVVIVTRGALPAAPSDSSGMGVPGVVVTLAGAKPLLPGAGLDGKAVWEPKKAGKPAPLTVELSLSARLDPVEAKTWNVAGVLHARPGAKRAGEHVVVGAHYDHLGWGGIFSRAPAARAIHPGADDNASGTALLFEIARRFQGLARPPERDVLFLAFSAEEIGTIGSRYWVDHPTVPLSSVVAMINADMVGRLRDDHLLLDGTGTSAVWPELVRAANTGIGLNITLGAEGFGASDHASFTAARVPVAFLFTGAHDDYHLPSDTADKINAAGEERIATLAARLALAVAEAPQRPEFIDAPADPHKSTRGGFKVSLGTIPDYAYQGKGLRLTGVRPDAPAARAGMKGGDVIVKVGSHEITNIHDYMFALGELEAGREMVIEVERDGARVPLKVIPAPGTR